MFGKILRNTLAIATVALLAAASTGGPLPVCAEGLAFDTDHDLLVLKDCNLAVRYNNKTFVPVKLSNYSVENGYFLDQKPLKSIQIGEKYSDNMQSSAQGERIIIECFDVGEKGRISTNRLNKKFLKANKVKEINLTYDRIAKETGATKTGLHSLRTVLVFEVSPSDGTPKYRLFAFQYDNILTMYARRMRPNTSGFDDAAPVIVSQLSFQLEPTLEGNVKVE